ncbi:hypothetical protein [Streptomyces lasiicapitis]|uniref:hypothetical protein n=1 Tax=Streptomyces lasiicapitis TaxID=1923961 RepID=UPI0036BE3081
MKFRQHLARVRRSMCALEKDSVGGDGDAVLLLAFGQRLERGLDAVIADLTQPWNSGVVEGHVDRIKMLKRQMFGRTGFELHRERVLRYA